MKAIILAGGMGERLRPLTCVRPKPLTRVCGREVLLHILEQLHSGGVTECALTLRTGADAVRDFVQAHPIEGLKVTFFEEREPLGTAGGVKACEAFAGEDTLIISGDLICDLDLGAAFEFHKKNKADATLLLYRVKEPTEYGVVRAAQDGRIESFYEKPSWDRVCADTVNTGIYIIHKSVFSLIPEKTPYDFGAQLFPEMLRQEKRLYGLISDGYWCDIGSVEAFLQCTAALLDGRLSTFTPPPTPHVAGVKIIPPVLMGENCTVGRGCTLGPYTVLGDGCRLGDRVKVVKSSLGRGCRIGEGAVLEGCALDDKVFVGENAVLHEGAALGEGASVGAGAEMAPSVKLSAGKALAAGEVLSCGASGDSFGTGLFDEDGVRGRLGQDLTAVFAARLGAAIGSVRQGKTLVGYAGQTGAMIASGLSAGLLNTGCEAYCLENATASLVRYTTAFCGFDTGVAVTVTDGEAAIRVYEGDGMPLRAEHKLNSVFLREAYKLSARVPEQFSVRGAYARYANYADSLCEDLKGLKLTVESEDPVLADTALNYYINSGAEAGDAYLIHLDSGGERFTLETAGKTYADLDLLPALFPRGHCYAPAYLPRYGHDRLTPADSRDGYAVSPEHFDNFLAVLKILSLIKQGKTLAQLSGTADKVYIAQREIELSGPRAQAMARLAQAQGDKKLGAGITFLREGGQVQVCAVKNREALRITAAAYKAETAEEICADLYEIAKEQGLILDK